MSVEVRAIREEEREECVQLWCAVWGGEANRPYFSKYFYGDVEWLPYYTIVAKEEGRLVSAVHICKRIVPCGEYRLVMGGIANVATLPKFRGKGYNTQCLQKAIEVMEADAMDFSLLFTGINGYYARLGYETLPGTLYSGDIRADFTPSPSPYLVRPASAEDIPALQSLYAQYNAQRPLSVQRTPAYWRDWCGVSPSNVPEGISVAIDASGKAVGYLRRGRFNSAEAYSPQELEVRITEFAADDGDYPGAAQALYESVAQELKSAGAKRLRLGMLLDPVIEAAVSPVLESIEASEARYGMFRILHPTNLFKSLTFGMNERWAAAGRPQGAITIQTPYGYTRLDATGDFLAVRETEAAERTITQGEFLGLLFGSASPQSVATSPEEEALFEALFEKRRPCFWGADGF